MNRILVLVVTGGLLLGMASESRAQFALSVGNPYTGGFSIGAPGAYYGAPGFGYGGYGIMPGTTIYNSGYSVLAPTVAPYAYPYGYYGYAPYYRTGYYGFAPYRGGLFGLRRGYVGGFW